MKEIGRRNVSKELTDLMFDKDHKGIAVKDIIGTTVSVVGFVIYDMGDGTYHLKFVDAGGADYYTSSQVYIKEFMRIAKTTADDAVFDATAIEAESKKGRKYITIKESIPSVASDEWKNINW